MIQTFIRDNYGEIPEKQLRQTAILRHGRLSRKRLARSIDHMRGDPFGFVSFYVFALKGKKVVGFAYFCQDEGDAARWYYGDLVVHKKCRRGGVATAIVEEGIRALREKQAATLFTYIDHGNEASIAFHEKLSFIRSERQEPINGFLMDGRVVYERTL